jgi:hypothetical protein
MAPQIASMTTLAVSCAGIVFAIRECSSRIRHKRRQMTARSTSSRWIVNSGPTRCFACGQPFPQREGRVEARVGADDLYCYGTTCEADALEARSLPPRRPPQ